MVRPLRRSRRVNFLVKMAVNNLIERLESLLGELDRQLAAGDTAGAKATLAKMKSTIQAGKLLIPD
jgi:HPt (histidine-containing phosphotransfer) domain-containing protein